MNKRNLVMIISAVSVIVIAVCVLFLTGVIRLPFGRQTQPEKKPELYIEYMNEYMLIDEDGKVLRSTSELPEDIPKVNGVDFSRIIVGETLTAQNEEAYAYAKRIVAILKKAALPFREVYISSDLQASLYVNNVRVLLGADNKTEEKINEMRDFYDDFKDLSGTLDMTELSKDNLGYTLRPD